MAKKITLYIEDTDIKLLVTKGKQVEKWASLLLEPSLVRDGAIVDEDQVAESIKTLMKLGGVKTKKVSVGISGLNSIFRIITLPELSQNLLPEAILNEARRVIPVPLDQVYLSHQRIESSAGEIRLFLVAYPRNTTDVLIKTLNKAGLKPNIMDLAPLALARCANEPRAVVVNSWLSYLDVIIMVDKIPQVIRSLSLPTEAVAIEEKMPFIAEELARTVAFYNSSNPANRLETTVPVFICGDLAETPDNWQSLVGQSDYPVSALTPPVEYPETFSPCKFMVNLGLALKNQVPRGESDFYSIIDLNALPEGYKPVAFNVARILTPIAIIVGIAAIAYGGLLIKEVNDDTIKINNQIAEAQAENDIMRLQISSVANDITELKEKIAPLPEQAAQIESRIESLKIVESNFISVLNGLSQGLIETDADLKEAVALKPITIVLDNITYQDDSMIVKGNAPHEQNVLGFARALRSSEQFNDVIVSEIREVYIQEYGENTKMFEFDIFLR